MNRPDSPSHPSEVERLPPRITVIVFVYGARPWLTEALDSALHQRLPSELFEILLVGQLPAAERTRALEGRLVRYVASVVPELGPKAAVAVAEARGEILVFLEDDDRFLDSKLDTVLRTFDADPRLTYYHNSFRAIDALGSAIPPPHFRSDARTRIRGRGSVDLPAGQRREALRSLSGFYPAYNNSSISVRRTLLLPWLEALARIDLLLDQFLFVAALCSQGSLRVGAEELTEIRLHRGSVSHAAGPQAGDLPRLRAFSGRNRISRELLLEMARASEDPEVVGFVEGSNATEATIAALRGQEEGRTEMAGRLRTLCRRATSADVRTYPGVIPLAALYLLWPRLARLAYRSSKRLESRSRPPD